MSKFSVGDTIGRWTVVRLSREEVTSRSATETIKYWKVRCQCGLEGVYPETKLVTSRREGKGGCTKKACQNRKLPI